MITYTLNQFGLRDKDMQYMYNLFTGMPQIEKVILYGSRAAGNFEKGSDVDLALAGINITCRHIAHVHDMLENESPTLLWFDVLHYNTLKNEKLKKSIDQEGIVIFERGKI